MRKNLIATSVATLLAGFGLAGGAAANVLSDSGVSTTSPSNADAQEVRAGGIGHQLILPTYNVQNGNSTLFTIVNTDTVNGKAVKIRFRGASNSDDVFDFQVYMSPTDVWSANISRGADGRAVLTTSDTSCTLPAVVSGTSFVTARLPATFTADNLAAQTREGYVEIFNMADIPPNAIDTAAATLGAALGTANPLFTAIKHVAGVPPCSTGAAANATAINALQTDPTTLTEAYAKGFRAPTGTLFGNYLIINVPKSGAASGETTALVATRPAVAANGEVGPQPGRGNIVFFPQVGGAATTPDNFTADPVLRTNAGGVRDDAGVILVATQPVVAASFFDLPDLSTPYLPGQIGLGINGPINQAETLSRALATTAVINEFLTDPAIAANTDWAFSMPTRRYSVALDYRPMSLPVPAAARRVFTTFPNRDFYTTTNTSVVNTQICTTTSGVTYYNREEAQQVGTSFVISPNPPAPQFRLCGEVSVLTFNALAGASVLGAEVANTNFNTVPTIRDGWANVGTPGLTTSNFNVPLVAPLVGPNGLPILGKAFSRATNPAVAAGISGNFGASWEHRYVRPIAP